MNEEEKEETLLLINKHCVATYKSGDGYELFFNDHDAAQRVKKALYPYERSRPSYRDSVSYDHNGVTKTTSIPYFRFKKELWNDLIAQHSGFGEEHVFQFPQDPNDRFKIAAEKFVQLGKEPAHERSPNEPGFFARS